MHRAIVSSGLWPSNTGPGIDYLPFELRVRPNPGFLSPNPSLQELPRNEARRMMLRRLVRVEQET